MPGVPENFGEGHANLTPDGSQGEPTLAGVLRALNGEGANPIGWQAGIAVTANVATLGKAGYVFAIEATAATSPGPKSQIQSGSPAAGQVDVQYDADGVPTLTFNGADAVTECAATQHAVGKDLLP